MGFIKVSIFLLLCVAYAHAGIPSEKTPLDLIRQDFEACMGEKPQATPTCDHLKEYLMCTVKKCMKNGMDIVANADHFKTVLTEKADNETQGDCVKAVDAAYVKEAIMSKCEDEATGTTAEKCGKQFMCAVVERPKEEKDMKAAAEELLEKVKEKKECAGEDLKIDADFLRKAVTARKLMECKKTDDPAAGKDETEKCDKLKKTMKCSIGNIGQGYDILKNKDELQNKMKEEATKLGLKEACFKDFVSTDQIQGALEEKCKKDEKKPVGDESDSQKCDKIKKRMGCVGASMVKKENLSLKFAKDNFMSLVNKVKDAATKEKLTDCKSDALSMMSAVKGAYMGGDATMAQVSFISLIMALTAAVMLR